MLTILAPAKINLTLEVLGKRPDGYHEVRSLVQAISLCDTLRLETADDVIFTSDMPGWSAEKSLLSKTVNMLQNAASVSTGVNVAVQKRIPLMSGLGGDSSDAAALLKGLNKLWDLRFYPEKLAEMGAEVGSDIPFFLNGTTALAEGRGEKITPFPPFPQTWVLLVKPELPSEEGKTARMYGALKTAHFTDGSITQKFIEAIYRGDGLEASLLFNTFESIAFEEKKIRAYVEHLLKMGAPNVHLAGAGPALFSLFEDRTLAQALATRCKTQGMEAYLAETL